MLSIVATRQDVPSDVISIRRIFLAAPEYTQLIEGRPPGEADVEDFFCGLPPGKSPADKGSFGFMLGNEMVGCAEMLRHYPEDDIAWIGLLLFHAAHQRQGFGTSAVRMLSDVAVTWEASRIGIAVVSTNLPAHAFWLREGFKETRRVQDPTYLGDKIVMERPLV